MMWHRHDAIKKGFMSDRRAGYIYVYGGNGVYKIGYSKDPERRVRSLATLPWSCELALTFATIDAPLLEQQLHRHFSRQRLKGEWFQLSHLDLLNIPQLVEALINRPAKQPVYPIFSHDRNGPIRLNITKMIEDLEKLTGSWLSYEDIEREAGLPGGTLVAWGGQQSTLRVSKKLGRFLAFLARNGLQVRISDYHIYEVP